MNHRIKKNSGRGALLAAFMVTGVVAAHAAGLTILRSQEAQIQPGMTMGQVVQMLGRPAENSKYMGAPGATLSYGVVNSDMTMFDVAFGSDGKVIGKSERAVFGGR